MKAAGHKILLLFIQNKEIRCEKLGTEKKRENRRMKKKKRKHFLTCVLFLVVNDFHPLCPPLFKCNPTRKMCDAVQSIEILLAVQISILIDSSSFPKDCRKSFSSTPSQFAPLENIPSAAHPLPHFSPQKPCKEFYRLVYPLFHTECHVCKESLCYMFLKVLTLLCRLRIEDGCRWGAGE